jgi:hypothetical protein
MTRIRDECGMAPESRNSPLLDNGSLRHIVDDECDMAPESRKSPLLDNVSVSTSPRQRIDGITDEQFEMMIYIGLASKLQNERSVQS